MNADEIDRLARLIWDYGCLHQEPVPADAVLAFCSHDTRVAARAARLVLDGLGRYLVISGGFGVVTKRIFREPEARVYQRTALKLGVPEDHIIVEDKSSNTGENVTMSYAAAKRHGLHFKSVILVHKPYMERRALATFKKQWPDPHTKVSVTSPPLDFDHYFTPQVPKELNISLMVGDLLRMKAYAAKRFQIEQDIPQDVWDAGQKLFALGYGQRPQD